MFIFRFVDLSFLLSFVSMIARFSNSQIPNFQGYQISMSCFLEDCDMLEVFLFLSPYRSLLIFQEDIRFSRSAQRTMGDRMELQGIYFSNFVPRPGGRYFSLSSWYPLNVPVPYYFRLINGLIGSFLAFYSALGLWLMAQGSWLMTHGSWLMTHGLWLMAHGQ